MAITWAGGVNPIILDNGTFTWADIATADTGGGWGQFTSNGTNVPSYRSRVSVQIGNSANTTHLQDATGSLVVFDNTRTITGGGTATARFLTLGTRLGSGARASGVNGGVICLGAATVFAGTPSFYGLTVRQTSGAVSFVPTTAGTGEAINCLFQSTASGTAPFSFATATNSGDNIYNCDFSHTTANQVVSNLTFNTAERLTIAAASPTAFFSSGGASVVMRSLAMFGTPTQSDIRWATSGAQFWSFVRPIWTGNAPKISVAAAGPPISVDNAQTREFWGWDVKVVDGDGNGIAGIPVTLTDATGEVQVSATTNSEGELDYTQLLGSVAEPNVVCVMDHYAVGTTYTQRHRSPFLVEVNTGASRNTSYQSHRARFDFAGAGTVTTSAGSFEDMFDVIALEPPAGNPTTWVELEL